MNVKVLMKANGVPSAKIQYSKSLDIIMLMGAA